MKTSLKLALATLALGFTVSLASAQDAGNRPPREDRPQRQMGGPLMQALDANQDGVIDEREIANAPAALKTLDKNNDGKLTAEEVRPQRPGGVGGAGGPGGPGGFRGGEGEGRPRGPRPPGGAGQ